MTAVKFAPNVFESTSTGSELDFVEVVNLDELKADYGVAAMSPAILKKGSSRCFVLYNLIDDDKDYSLPCGDSVDEGTKASAMSFGLTTDGNFVAFVGNSSSKANWE